MTALWMWEIETYWTPSQWAMAKLKDKAGQLYWDYLLEA